ncbi:MAG: c-type cytochrome [Rhodospirillales bacterium]
MLRWLVPAAVVGFLAATVAAVALTSGGDGIDERSERVAGLKGDATRGAYVARLAGCIACHTDAKGGGGFLAGGAPLETPFGVFRAPNITQHPEDGIGNWSAGDLARALTAGTAPNGDHYYPVLPYDSYHRMADQDIADLWEALKTVPPIAGKASGHELGFPFNQRVLMGAWKSLFLDSGPFEPEPERSDAWNRGAYLVTGPGHCGACHTPRNVLGAMDRESWLEGGPNGPRGEKVPALTAKALKSAGWSERDLIFGLKYGTTPTGDALGGSMGEVIRDGTRWFSDADLQAIATYLLGDERSPDKNLN